jgi:uncharacterized protein (TIGR03083 family)
MDAGRASVFGTDVIATHAHDLAELGRGHALDTPVPTCGDWTLADLVWHLAEVQDFWCHIIGNRPQGPDTYDRPDRPADDQLPDLLDDRCRTLVDLLDIADPGDHAWSWSDDHTVGFTVRRQSHEALVHHLDGVLAVGASLPDVDAALAADGVDELVTVMLTGVPDWATYEPDDRTIRLVAADAGRTWPLRFGRMVGTSPDSGRTYDLTALEIEPDLDRTVTTVAADALDLDLWLWGRGGDVTIEGDPDGAELLRAAVFESTQ